MLRNPETQELQKAVSNQHVRARMSGRIWKVFLWFVLACSACGVLAETPNVGYYEKVGEDGDWSIYRMYRSVYLPGVEDEQTLPGDETVYWGDDVEADCEDMESDSRLCPIAGEARGNDDQGSATMNSKNGDELPEVFRIKGSRPESHVVIIKTSE